ncbi:MAG: hypothetical protein HQL99_01435 [Magnetococcales bacterium]|nr:hypothetical protein [Magnetococcales bacterium]
MDTQPTSSSTSPRSAHWLDRISWPILLVLAGWLAVAPLVPEPHLIEKIRMLFAGTLVRLIDIFDLFLHTTPLVVVALKVVRQFHRSP